MPEGLGRSVLLSYCILGLGRAGFDFNLGRKPAALFLAL